MYIRHLNDLVEAVKSFGCHMHVYSFTLADLDLALKKMLEINPEQREDLELIVICGGGLIKPLGISLNHQNLTSKVPWMASWEPSCPMSYVFDSHHRRGACSLHIRNVEGFDGILIMPVKPGGYPFRPAYIEQSQEPEEKSGAEEKSNPEKPNKPWFEK